MAKILLVEDDNNLREIYEARLQAEGYTIVSAHDGEEALVVAKSEKPNLIISDVMMPKISGFEMLDILRNTDTLKDVKVIMLTALGQSDDQERANKLGSDRYLVKSQVTLEDIVNVANELLQPGAKPVDATMPSAPTTDAATSPSDPAATTPPASEPANDADPATPTTSPSTSEPTADPSPMPEPPAPTLDASSDQPVTPPPPSDTDDRIEEAAVTKLAEPAADEQKDTKTQIENFMDNQNNSLLEEESKNKPLPVEDSPKVDSADDAPSLSAYKMSDVAENEGVGYIPQPAGKKVIQPLPGGTDKPDINELLEKERAKEIVDNAEPPEEAPPTMSAADTAPTPAEPVIKPVPISTTAPEPPAGQTANAETDTIAI